MSKASHKVYAAWGKLPGAAKAAVAIVGFLVVVGFLLLIEQAVKQANTRKGEKIITLDASKENIESKSSTPSPPPVDPKEVAERKAKYSAECLKNAKAAMADGYAPKGKSPSWGKVKDARNYLEQIQSDAKEYPEAKKLLIEVERREAAIDAWAKSVAREYYSNELEKKYLSQGMDVKVSVSGKDNTVLKLSYVLMSRPMVYQLTNDSNVISTLRDLGFKKAIFTDGYYNTWTQDLD